jgi:hypothetical protein
MIGTDISSVETSSYINRKITHSEYVLRLDVKLYRISHKSGTISK